MHLNPASIRHAAEDYKYTDRLRPGRLVTPIPEGGGALSPVKCVVCSLAFRITKKRRRGNKITIVQFSESPIFHAQESRSSD